MSPQSIPGQAEDTIIQAVRTVIHKRPVLEPIIWSFAQIAMEKRRLGHHLEGGPPAAGCLLQNLDLDRLARGVPLLAGVAFDPLRNAMDQIFDAMLVVMRRVFSQLAAAFASVEDIRRRGQLDTCKTARAYLDGDASILGALAESSGVSPAVLTLVLNSSLSAMLKKLQPELAAYAREVQWLRGYCPICGSMPSISYLAEAGDLGSEFLKGGGGQRYLHCSLCGHEWRFMRSKCPACDTEESGMHLYFQMEEESSERIDICRNCGGYLPCLDLRETTQRMPMDIVAVGMIHLDAWASEKGYHPLAPSPWNLIQ
jgi:FdhE protein